PGCDKDGRPLLGRKLHFDKVHKKTRATQGCSGLERKMGCWLLLILTLAVAILALTIPILALPVAIIYRRNPDDRMVMFLRTGRRVTVPAQRDIILDQRPAILRG